MNFFFELKIPMVNISVVTFVAYTLHDKQPAANIDPDIVTARQPYLFTNEDEIGPEEV